MLRTSLVLGLVLSFTSLAVADEEKKAAPAATKEVKVGDIKMSVPKTWKQEKPANRLRLAQFKIPAVKGEKDAAELTVFFFGATSGSVGQNLQRWIQQFNAQGRKASIVQGKSKQGKYHLLDMSWTYNRPIGPPIQRRTKPTPGSRMVGVILQVEKKGAYYFKITGPDKTVTKAGDAFRKSIGADKKMEKKQAL